MLFILEHSHTAEMCPAGIIHPQKDFTNDLNNAAKAAGVKIVEGYLDSAAHHMYFVVEAKDNGELFNFSLPFLGIGTTHIAPVLPWSEAVQAIRKAGRQK